MDEARSEMTSENRRIGPVAQLLLVAGILIWAVAIAGFVVTQHRTPNSLSSRFGDGVAGARFYARVLDGRTPAPLRSAEYATISRLTLGAAWAGYALAVGVGLYRGLPRGRVLLAGVGAVAAAIAIGCPPTLSEDVFSYAAYGRMRADHGINPYAGAPASLASLGDEVGLYTRSGLPSVYGPVWTGFCVAQARVLRSAGLWWQVAGFKLVAAAGLLAAAAAGRSLVGGGHRGDLAALAIGANPLLLVEGPGNGHADLPMMGLLLTAAAFARVGEDRRAGLTLGLAVGIKYLPIAIVPWLLLGRRRSCAWQAAALGVTLAALPTLVAFVPLWRGADLAASLQRRALWGSGLGDDDLLAMASPLDRLGLPAIARKFTILVVLQWPVIDLYLLLTFAIARRRPAGPGAWLLGWVVLSAAFAVWTMSACYPWYLTWPMVPALAGRGRLSVATAGVCSLASVWMMSGYFR